MSKYQVLLRETWVAEWLHEVEATSEEEAEELAVSEWEERAGTLTNTDVSGYLEYEDVVVDDIVLVL